MQFSQSHLLQALEWSQVSVVSRRPPPSSSPPSSMRFQVTVAQCDHGSVSKSPAHYRHQNEALTLTPPFLLKGLVWRDIGCACVRVCAGIKSHFMPAKVLRLKDCYNAAPVWQSPAVLRNEMFTKMLRTLNTWARCTLYNFGDRY